MNLEMAQILFAFGGGLFGTLLGSLNAFIIFGLVLIFGIVLNIVGMSLNVPMYDWIGGIAFGAYMAPFISFLGGACAAMYAGKKKYIESGKMIDIPLIKTGKIDVYIVGGVFGVIGYLFAQLITFPYFGDKVDGGAFTIIIISLIAKYIFNGTVLGEVPKSDLDLGGRFSLRLTNVWQPAQRKIKDKLAISLGVGITASIVTYNLYMYGINNYVAAYLCFAVSTVSLIYLHLGIPVTHHISVCAGYAVVAFMMNTGSTNIYLCLAWGIMFAIISTFLGDITGSLFYIYGDCHIDPPGAAILPTSMAAMYFFPKLGLYNFNMIPIVIIILTVIYGVYSENKEYKNIKVGEKVYEK